MIQLLIQLRNKAYILIKEWLFDVPIVCHG